MRAILLVATLVAGCAASGVQVSERAALQFKEGVTTESEIVQTLGKPTSVYVAQGIRVISYSGMQYQVKGATFIPIVGAFAGGADYAFTTASYEINGEGTLTKVTYTQHGSGSRSGTNPMPATPREPTAVR